MNKKLTILLSASAMTLCSYAQINSSSRMDSLYLFSYANPEESGQNGLHFAWSSDKAKWHTLGDENSFLKCDFGPWGKEKRMYYPYIYPDETGKWHCIWQMNQKTKALAHAESDNLINWSRQKYFINMPDNVSQSDYDHTQTVILDCGKRQGHIIRVHKSLVDALLKEVMVSSYKSRQNTELCKDDPQRFNNLKPLQLKLRVDGAASKPISQNLIGIFFEDINYAADGGLYAELIQNRDFEYNEHDQQFRKNAWNALYAWKTNDESSISIETQKPLTQNNGHYLNVKAQKGDVKLTNSGFDGIVLKEGEKYNLSLFLNPIAGKAQISVSLIGDDGRLLCTKKISAARKGWNKQNLVLIPTKSAIKASLCLTIAQGSNVCIDMVSLFPQKTFMNRQNGMRADLAKAIADLKPKFMRFPGGCVAHGDGLSNIYDWKGSIGPLESRKPLPNIWRYHQTRGLGYHEFFQFCEDLGCAPLPVIAAGVCCQNSQDGGDGQQGGIPMEQMEKYTQDIIDLIEWANGSKNTYWGKIRASQGHPKPFGLKYIGIGNEDLISDEFEERFNYIYSRIKEKHPEITIIGTVGPFNEGTDYEEGWKIARDKNLDMVDEHYYQTPGWFVNNQDFYDTYQRGKTQVYLGEYAAHMPRRERVWESALAEAIYLLSVERNADVVTMTSYAPLLAKEGHTQWNPDLIYFSNTEVKTTPSYEVQKAFSHNSGSEYITSSTELTSNSPDVRKRVGISIVKANSHILKAVNMLPVTISSDLAEFASLAGKDRYHLTIMSSEIDGKKVEKKELTLSNEELSQVSIPAYSMIVIR